MRIVELNLASSQLVGSIFPMIFLLPYLHTLNLSNNNFTGPIPSSHTSLLSHIDLSNNKLSGPLPSQLGLLSHLQTLNLYYNNLTGTLPSSLANCTGLVQLSLYGNELVGTIPPQFGTLTKLKILELSFNNLAGPIPPSIFTNCTGLTSLALSDNLFEGALHPHIGQLKDLERLWIDGNHLSGNIPESIGNLSSLSILSLYSNNFTGVLPASLGQLASLSLLFSISDNLLTGHIPPTLGNLSSLIILTLRGNYLTGSIPNELGKLQNLQGLFLEDNMLTGAIPSEISHCAMLEELKLSNNLLEGSIPPNIGQLQLLTSLNLDSNMLQGILPSTLSNLTRLQDLSLGYNKLIGGIPEELASVSTIQFGFSLTHNLFTGTIPSQLGQMVHAQKIDLSHNNFSGSIPSSLGDCSNLHQLNLSYNSLTGRIPPQLEKLKLLSTLDLTHNALSGAIPTSLTDLPALKHLNLSYNSLQGPIPSGGSFQNLTSASFISNPGLCGSSFEVPCTQRSSEIIEKSRSGLSGGGVVAIALACVALLGAFCWMGFYMAYRRRDRIIPTALPSWNSTMERGNRAPYLRRYASYELRMATEGFNERNIIGRGALSIVYRGVLMNEKEVAIKRFTFENTKDSWSSFCQELKTLGSIRHRNLVKIFGYCFDAEVTALVLEYMPQGSLEAHLYNSQNCDLTCEKRLQIAIDVAQALVYLHDGCNKPIVHCDLKPSNILLDSNMQARVTDFGIAKLLATESGFRASSSSGFKGSFGYIPPEFAECMRITTKTDVYSYGVTILEMVLRKRPTDEVFVEAGRSMGECIRSAESVERLLDPNLLIRSINNLELGEEGDGLCVLRHLVEVGLQCTELNPRDRPSMKDVVAQLLPKAPKTSTLPT